MMAMNEMRKSIALMALIATMLAAGLGWLTGCGTTDDGVPQPANAVYHWKQELDLNPHERDWMQRHDVQKMYLHLFDVVRQSGQLQPSTTLSVTSLPPAGVRVVPVVFLAHDIMRDTTGITALPRLLARRVRAIMEQNELGPLDELQIDFDWTRSNQARFFALLTDLGRILDATEGRHVTLSATIRLHQLSLKVPPVDYGALMVYNLGDLRSFETECSILSMDLLKPYLRYLRGYELPLTVALPVYNWDILFHDHQFRCVLRGVDLTDTTAFEPLPLEPSRIRARRYQPIPPSGVAMRGDGRIFPGDIIRHEQVPADVLKAVRKALAKERASACRQIILYHIDENQLNEYSDEDIETIYTGH